MPRFFYRSILFLNAVLLLCVLSYSVYRDINLERQYPGDLRNRVVGARLQRDGRPPYFYKWKKGDGYEYFDPQNKDSLKVSNITATPAFHELMIPISYLQQRTISITWLWLQYVFLAVITLLFLNLCSSFLQKTACINFAVLFTLTAGWKAGIAAGQLYLFITFLISCIIFGLLKKERKLNLLLAVCCTAVLILTRPICMVILLPFIFQYKKYAAFIFGTFIVVAAYSLVAFFNPLENSYWKSYAHALQEQVKIHQGTGATLQQNDTMPTLKTFEGFDFNAVHQNEKDHPFIHASENGNVFVLYAQLFHKKLPVSILALSLCIILLVLQILFKRKELLSGTLPQQIIILSFLFYLLAEIFSPVYRHQYNSVQWLPVVLTGMLLLKKQLSLTGILFWAGLLLNILNTDLLPMRHTFGECCWLAALLIMVFKKPDDILKWKLQ